MEPDVNADLAVLGRKRARLGEDHVAPIVDLCDEIVQQRELPSGAVPYPDPDQGGVGARALFVLSHPGASAPDTRFLSLGNQDDGANLQLSECERAGVPVAAIAHWNIVPFPISGKRPDAEELREGAPWLTRLIGLLPALRVVVLFGAPASKKGRAAIPRGRGLAVIEGPSPSPPEGAKRAARVEIAAAFDEVASVLRGGC